MINFADVVLQEEAVSIKNIEVTSNIDSSGVKKLCPQCFKDDLNICY